SYLRGIPPSAIVQAIAEFFNTNIMTFDVEGTYAARINFPTDLLLFVSTFYLVDILIKQGFNKKPSFQFCLILLSVVLSISRFIWAVNLVALILAIMVNVKSKKSIFVIVSFLFLSTIIVQIDSVQDIFMSRYSSSANDYSDSKREIQQKSIFREFDKAELLGNGLGSHAQLLRSFTPGKLYIYELQFQAFLMQVGMIGMFLFLMYVYFLFLIFSKKAIIKFRVIALIFLIFWIVSSFYNPSLFTSSGGAILLYILSLSCISSYRKVAFNYAENQ
ncbi:O-antigen ligase family protein, partial [Rosenbergiella epipactidis]|uniref:O-antigen ligase family protein n=1 Tax=Rosenbergiella epipactidis TaxID=1544694 RepID=UPI001F4F2388